MYLANIPELTLLEGVTRDGKAVKRSTISTGYGVRFSITGHDLHGPRLGPDGRLYFSIGDRGSHVVSREGRVFDRPDEGAVYRCDPDGMNLELFATGLRNPQDLAFDDLGNLVIVDNNCDLGDAARVVLVVEGSDSGWRVGYQFSETTPAGIWNSEKLWHLRWPGQAAYILPPIGHLTAGPSGLAYYPGTGFDDSFLGHFFICDFRGQSTGSGIHSFTLKPQGGGYALDKSAQFLWDILATDADFGPDGRLYVSDWVHGWPKSERGRIYRLTSVQGVKDPAALETAALLRKGLAGLGGARLVGLLGHRDQRIRQEAQFALAARGRESLRRLNEVLRGGGGTLPRLHALWAIGQIARRSEQANALIRPCLGDADAEIRAHAARILGETEPSQAWPLIVPLLKDPAPRVRWTAAIALGRAARGEVLAPVREMLRENDDQDLYLRHGGVMALAGIPDAKAIAALAADPSAAVRLAAVLALRRQQSSETAVFLGDRDARVALEAARAINDLTLVSAMPALAAQALTQPERFRGGNAELATPWMRRVMNANYRVGGEAAAARLTSLAGDPGLPDAVRAEALLMLGQWARPTPRDKVSGLWRPLDPRPAAQAVASLQPAWPSLLKASASPVQRQAIRSAAALEVAAVAGILEELALDVSVPGENRVEALRALSVLHHPGLAALAAKASADRDELVRKEGVALQANTGGVGAIESLARVLETGSIPERQNAFTVLGSLPGAGADALILRWLGRPDAPAAVQLDLVAAAEMRKDPAIVRSLAERTARLPKSDPLAPFRLALAGGNAANGRKIFHEKAEAACVRCHKMRGEGGDVGPDLTHLAEKQPAEYLLESILFPNARIAPGFESVMVTSKDGGVVAGVLKSETPTTLEINSPEDGLVRVAKGDLVKREKGQSGMPEGFGAVLTRQEIRDLIAFLTSRN